jgi:predicted adenylyl cyclase CyaB
MGTRLRSPTLLKTSAPRRNIEIKARIGSIESVREICEQFATFSAYEHQIDTYFLCPQGRLKLREREGQAGQLVAYARANTAAPRASDYWLVPVDEARLLKTALTATLGVLAIVEKHREVFLYERVRIHLDRVVQLGDFLELEAVLSPADDESQAAQLVSELAERLSIDASDLVDRSYSDLLLVKQRGWG